MDERYILFENYLTNKISEEERIAFEEKLKNDISFNQDFELYKNTFSFLENKFKNEENLNEFTKNLQKISDENFKSAKKKTFKIWQYGAVASVLLLVGIFFFNNSGNPSYDDFVDYNTIELAVRNSQNDVLSKAENAYNSKDFTSAVTYFDDLLKENPNNSEIQLYKGFSLIELNKFDEAQKELKSIANGKSAFKNKANWYLALSNLKQQKFVETLKYLQMIPESADEYVKAQKLINKLD